MRELIEALRYLFLPIHDEDSETLLKSVVTILSNAKIDEEDYGSFIKMKFDEWKGTGKLNAALYEIISCVIEQSDKDRGKSLAKAYFDIQSTLREGTPHSFELIAILLSQLRLIAALASNERMSSVKITKILKSIDGRLSSISWKEVQVILTKLHMVPSIDQKGAEALYNEDSELCEIYLADSDIKDAAFLVGEVAKKLEFTGDLELLLNQLTDPDNTHTPYLQILHYQCLISGFYDHVVSYAYEFSPRGNVAGWLFNKWDGLSDSSNPFLNNAKAVDVLDRNWANSRKTNELVQARALADILHGIDEMGFSASIELSACIRRFLIKYIKIKSSPIVPVPAELSAGDIRKLTEIIISKPTKTYGVLEQRIIDVYSSAIYVPGEGWRPRGVGDSVNSNNLSKKKLGDCDFQHPVKKEIVAFEAHGGKLTEIYYEGHIRTLARALKERMKELEGIADMKEWSITIVFVAYDFSFKAPAPFVMENANFNIVFLKFSNLEQDIITSEGYLKSFMDLFIPSVNNKRTPKAVRDYVLSNLK